MIRGKFGESKGVGVPRKGGVGMVWGCGKQLGGSDMF